MKQTVSEHHSGAGYRDQTVSVAESGLEKKVYNKANSSKKKLIIYVDCIFKCVCV